MEWSVIEELATLAPVEAVAGNMDTGELRLKLQRRRIIEVGKVKIGLIHGDGGGYNTPLRALQSFREFSVLFLATATGRTMKGTVMYCSLTPGRPRIAG